MFDNQRLSKETEKFSKKLHEDNGEENDQSLPTQKSGNDYIPNFGAIKFEDNKSQNKEIKNIESLPTFQCTQISHKEYNSFLLSITENFNSIMKENYNIRKKLSCPSIDVINTIQDFEEVSLYFIFICKNKKNEKILETAFDLEKKNNKTIMHGLMSIKFKEMYSNYKNDCNVFFWKNYIYILDDFLYAKKDSSISKEDSVKSEKRKKKEPKRKNVKAKRLRKKKKNKCCRYLLITIDIVEMINKEIK